MNRVGLGRDPENFTALSPLTFLPDGGDPSRPGRDRPRRRRITHRDFLARSRRLAGPLAAHGIGGGDTVSAVLPNVPAMLEAHHGVPMLGAVR